jgi:hypothetical protein
MQSDGPNINAQDRWRFSGDVRAARTDAFGSAGRTRAVHTLANEAVKEERHQRSNGQATA